MSFSFDIDVLLDEFNDLASADLNVNMICFHGSMETDFFKGTILPGGVDTQIEKTGTNRTLSARYMLDGVDKNGRATKLFIENNGVVGDDGQISTVPIIYTDNEDLRWLSTMKLAGKVIFVEEGHIMIHFEEV